MATIFDMPDGRIDAILIEGIWHQVSDVGLDIDTDDNEVFFCKSEEGRWMVGRVSCVSAVTSSTAERL